jgi:hypothetical protein
MPAHLAATKALLGHDDGEWSNLALTSEAPSCPRTASRQVLLQ